MKLYLYSLFLLSVISYAFFIPENLFAQQESDSNNVLKNLKISTYIDVYYAYDTDKDRSQRLYNTLSPYSNEFRLNIAQISFQYNTKRIRSVLTLHYGDIPSTNWIPSFTNTQYVQEAYIGLSPVKNLWIDAGYFLTHIGNESMPKNNYFNTFSFPVFFEPFFQSGVRVGYDFTEKFSACLQMLNGYNRFEDNNKNKSAGVQLNYSISENIKFSYNNIFGNEQPTGAPGKTSLFNNLVVYAYPCKKVELVGNFDLSIQEKSNLSDTTSPAYTYGAVVSARYKFCPCFSTSVRGEYYQDLDGVLNNKIPIKGNGITLGVEYKPVESSYLRLECRYLRLDDNERLFSNNQNQRTETVMSFGFEY